jgi:hypothetical protein
MTSDFQQADMIVVVKMLQSLDLEADVLSGILVGNE